MYVYIMYFIYKLKYYILRALKTQKNVRPVKKKY